MDRRSYLYLLACFGLVLLVACHNASAQPNTREHDLIRGSQWGQEAIGEGRVAPAAVNSIVSWSKLVFASARDGNWELYLAHANGSDPRRLTTHDAADLYPNLNHGATKVVFISTRHGNQDVYTTDADGANLRRLTNTAASEHSPSWSPDGTQILFNSYRDGQSEIYIMQADGSQVRRLTTHPAWDGEASWTPDGLQVVFVSDRTGDTQIWAVDVDGRNLRQLPGPNHARLPAVAPDGKRIAFTADNGSNGFYELWVMDSNGDNPRQLYSGAEKADQLASGWSADGRYIGFTSVEWIEYQGNWYWTSAEMQALDPNNSSDRFFLGSGDVNWWPSWGTTDVTPPQSVMQSLPTFIHEDNVVLQWSGADVGPAQLKHYDVQIRLPGDASWSDWLPETTATHAAFDGMPGQQVAFRVRAVDKAFNREPWPRYGMETTLYSWAISGLVQDNRGVAISDVAVDVAPTPFTGQTSTASGTFHAYVADDSEAFPTTWLKEGYGEIGATPFSGSSDAHTAVVLPPAEILVVNGQFEVDDTRLPGWDSQGSVTLTRAPHHLGSYAAQLGYACPYPCLSEPEPIPASSERHVTVDHQGGLHAVWKWYDASGPGYLVYGARGEDGVWTDPEVVDNDAYPGGPQVAVDEFGTVHVVWSELVNEGALRFYHRRRLPDGGWTASQPIVTCAADTSCWHVAFTAGVSGRLHFIYYADSYESLPALRYAAYTPDSGWLPSLMMAAGYNGDGNVDVVADRDGVLHALWADNDWGIRYRMRSAAGQWLVIESVDTTTHSGSGAYPPALALDGQGGLHAFWSYDFSGWYAHKPPGRVWSVPARVTNTVGDADLAVTPDGAIHLVNCDRIDAITTHYRTHVPDTGWSDPVELVDHDQSDPTLLVDVYGALHLVWGDGDGIHHYQTGSVAQTAGSSSISQEISIPQAMQAPTLAFAYAGAGVNGEHGGELRVAIDENNRSTSLLSTHALGAWQHAWADLTPWRGQTVTVSLTLAQPDGAPIARLWLDDISAGAAHPETWVAIVGPRELLPGDTATFTIRLGNQGGVDAESGELTVALPPGLRYVSAEPAPDEAANLLWRIPQLPAFSAADAIRLTVQVEPTAALMTDQVIAASLGTVTNELELWNNAVSQSVFIGRSVHLPAVVR